MAFRDWPALRKVTVQVENPEDTKKWLEIERESRQEAAERARETERQWYAILPIRVIVALCMAVALLTVALALVTAPKISSPDTKPAGPPAPPPVATLHLSAKELFVFGRSELQAPTGSAKSELDSCLLPNVVKVTVVGHTDCIGTDDYNLPLSQRRAMAVKDYLIGHGIPNERIAAEGRGVALARAEDAACASAGSVRGTAAEKIRMEKFRRVDVTCEGAGDQGKMVAGT